MAILLQNILKIMTLILVSIELKLMADISK